MQQQTLKQPVMFSGMGIHSGKPCQATLMPAPPNHGIVFEVEGVRIPARVEHICGTFLNTTLSAGSRKLLTVEHLMAALSGLDVDNALIRVKGVEIPALDGSSSLFAQGILNAGLLMQEAPRHYLRILKTVRVEDGERHAQFSPAAATRYKSTVILPFSSSKTISFVQNQQKFLRELAAARTFGFREEIQELQKMGYALGAGSWNAIALSRSGESENTLRFPDECIRHKLLDAIGDLALLGYRFLGAYQSKLPGHTLHKRLMLALLSDLDAWEIVQDKSELRSVAS